MLILHGNETRNFKILPFVLHGYQTPQLKILLSLLFLSHPIISKFYQHTKWNFFGFVIPLNIFLEIGRNYVSVIITIINNITVLVSHYVICFGYFISMSHGVNKKTPPIVSPRPSHLPGFHQVCLLFYNKYFINPFLF